METAKPNLRIANVKIEGLGGLLGEIAELERDLKAIRSKVFSLGSGLGVSLEEVQENKEVASAETDTTN